MTTSPADHTDRLRLDHLMHNKPLLPKLTVDIDGTAVPFRKLKRHVRQLAEAEGCSLVILHPDTTIPCIPCNAFLLSPHGVLRVNQNGTRLSMITRVWIPGVINVNGCVHQLHASINIDIMEASITVRLTRLRHAHVPFMDEHQLCTDIMCTLWESSWKIMASVPIVKDKRAIIILTQHGNILCTHCKAEFHALNDWKHHFYEHQSLFPPQLTWHTVFLDRVNKMTRLYYYTANVDTEQRQRRNTQRDRAKREKRDQQRDVHDTKWMQRGSIASHRQYTRDVASKLRALQCSNQTTSTL